MEALVLAPRGPGVAIAGRGRGGICPLSTPLPSTRTPIRIGLVVAFACLTLSGCDEKLSDLTGPTPNLKPTFASIQEQIFQSSDSSGRSPCVGCHQPGGPAGGVLNLRPEVAYNNLVNVASRLKAGAIRVIPGDPDNSYLIHKLEGRSGIFGLRMPQNGPPYLTEGQILVIRTWIRNGANNN
jgi:hypothetical protein